VAKQEIKYTQLDVDNFKEFEKYLLELHEVYGEVKGVIAFPTMIPESMKDNPPGAMLLAHGMTVEECKEMLKDMLAGLEAGNIKELKKV
jgi:hypothetical protein